MVRYQRIITGLVLLLSVGVSRASDETKRISWLASDRQEYISPGNDKQLSELLKPLSGSFRLLDCRYKNELLVETTALAPGSQGWEYNLATKKISPGHGAKKGEKALELSVTLKRTGEPIDSAGFALAFDFSEWCSDNYVLIPASVYNGNRNRIVNRGYNKGIDRHEMYTRNIPQSTASVPQLSPFLGVTSRIEVHTGNTATPAICFLDKKSQQGFILLAEQGIEVNGNILDNGLIVEESPDHSRASLVVNTPGIRELKPEFIGFSKSRDRGITWKTGDEYTIKLQLYRFGASDIPVLLEQFMGVRKNLTGPTKNRDQIPSSEVLRIMAGNIDKRFHVENQHRYYCPENANWISFGWIGGLMNTFPMLALGDKEHRERVKSTFDFGILLGQGESGYFYGALNKEGKVFGREAYDDFPEVVLTRKNADLLFWLVKQFMVFKAQGHSSDINPEWEQRVRRLADAFVSTWKKEHQWGNLLNNKTGGIAVYNTSSGVLAIGGLALASKYFDNPEYLTIAREAAVHYYDEFKKWGMTTGACADILQNSDSETAIALTTALMTLYETTGDKKWLIKSRDAANLSATWTVSFDYVLPADTPLARHGAKFTGTVWASTQNKHGAPGFCTQAGEALFKIYRYTGDERYAELMRDVIHAHAEGIQPNGLISERLTYCDADSRGAWTGRTGWNETNGAMMAIEIPGIYLRTDKDIMYCFDHIEAKVKKRNAKTVVLELTNPTKYDAEVSIFAESEVEAKKLLGCSDFLNWSKVKVKAGETITHQIDNKK